MAKHHWHGQHVNANGLSLDILPTNIQKQFLGAAANQFSYDVNYLYFFGWHSYILLRITDILNLVGYGYTDYG